MNKITHQQVSELISLHPEIVSFGCPEDAVSDEWIEKAEARLALPLSASYKWFLKNYAGGEIGGEEVYSIYGIEFESVCGGDIVYHHIIDLKNGTSVKDKLEVMATDLGEFFYFDYSEFKNGECPVVIKIPSGGFSLYASDFYDFLYKRIVAYL
jgi:hypothetical protein